jgi:DNA recombination protein RmuC
MEIALAVVASLVVGGLIGWLAVRNRPAADIQVAAHLIAEQEKNKSLAQTIDEMKKSLEAERNRVLELTNDLAATEANYRNLEEKLADGTNMQEKFAVHFKNLANDIFEEKTRKFTEQNKSNLFDLLKPLGEKIVEFERKVEDSHKDSIARNSALREQLENLQRLNINMTREAENLTRALKGDSQAQGAWGEFILESILEKSGLERDREYTIQETFLTEEGRRRPDVIIRLPEGRHVVIDSKVSLNAYNTFVNTTDEQERVIALKAHVVAIKQHLKSLSEKKYQNIADNGLDFVIMFIPIEPAYILAIQSERGLYDDALERRIVFVSPTLLIPSLQLIKNVWKQEYQNRHVIEIANKAGDLYDKFVGFTEDLIEIGRHLNTSKKYYEESMKKLSVGSGNLVRRVEELKKLGARANKNIDTGLLKKSEDQADLFD